MVPKKLEMLRDTSVDQFSLLLCTYEEVFWALSISSSKVPSKAFLHLSYPSSYQGQYVFLLKPVTSIKTTSSLGLKESSSSGSRVNHSDSSHDKTIFDELANRHSRVGKRNFIYFVRVEPNTISTHLKLRASKTLL
jgi:hypothetical protein